MKRYLRMVLTAATVMAIIPVCTSQEKAQPFFEVEVKGVRMDAIGQTPVVILADKAGKKALPIWIGLPEAGAIGRELQNIPSQRPMTHDLLYSILGQLGARVKEVKIVDLKDSTYFAKIYLMVNKEMIEIDARPSDAIVLALKAKSPIYVSAGIFDQQGIELAQERNSGERYGIRVQELTASLAFHFAFKGQKGVLVAEVLPESLASASGVKAGDIITKVNLKAVVNVHEFQEALDATGAGESIRIQIFRDGKSEEVQLVGKP
jgi:bifunctional DNase/RNase